MLVLDENLPAGQRQLLHKWRIRFRVVGIDVAAWGDDDENLIPVLHHLPQPTFFSLDKDFYDRNLLHSAYGLFWLDVGDDRAAEFIRRFLRHPLFKTQTQRMGFVARIHNLGITFYPMRRRSAQSVPWPGSMSTI